MAGVSITVLGKADILTKYGRHAEHVVSAMNTTMKHQMVQLADYVRANKLSGDPLNRRTGKLSRSITGDSEISGKYVTGSVGSKGVPYAHVHETGGTFEIPAHMRRVGFNARLERIKLLNRSNSVRAAVKAMSRGLVRAHTATYPQRAFLRPSMEENREKITEALKEAVMDVLHAT